MHASLSASPGKTSVEARNAAGSRTDAARNASEIAAQPHKAHTAPICRGRASTTEAANPIAYVNGLEPPIHVFHGTFDRLLPPGQSEALYEALQAAGSEASFTLVDGAGHSVDDIIDAEVFTVRKVNRGGHERVGQRPAPTWDTVEHLLHVALSRARR